MSEALDVLIIGAGSVGSSVAMHVGRMLAGQGKKICVIDPDLEGSYSSSERNAGGVRATMSDPLNIQISKLSLDYYASVADEVGFRELGYLWLSPDSAREQVARSMQTQKSLGWDVELWDLARIKKERPFLDKCEGVGFGWFGRRDGLINPNLLKLHFRSEARASGVEFRDRSEVVRGVVRTDGSGVDVTIRTRGTPWTEASLETYFAEGADATAWSEKTLRAGIVINCAGAWASEVAKRLGYISHVTPSRRQACLVETRGVDLTEYGMTVSPGGVYFHPEASYMVAGINEPETAPGFRFDFDGQSYFEEKVWPELYGLSSSFEELKLKSGWAGLYENTPDHSAIVGPVVGHESVLFECAGFSGHGVMQSYGAGLALAEKIAHGKYETLDLTSLSAERFASSDKSSWMKEGWVI